jgi:NAD(P)-dependent dehydrogenase (short-subunit alcohol dehydrogenase family)
MSLPFRSALVTGAGRGLGAALLGALCREGLAVVGVARTATELDAAVAAANADPEARARGGRAVAVVADLADKLAIHPLVATAQALVGPLDLVIHNASTLGPVPLKSLLDTECEELEAALQLNLVAPFRLTRLIAGNMVVRGGPGAVVFVTSDASVSAYPEWGAYGVSKAALDHLGRSFGAELADTAVRFVSVDPGEMDTRMHADAVPDADRATLLRPEEVARRIVRMLGDDRVPTGARIEAAAWAASPPATPAQAGTDADANARSLT